jgi:hypothetical protein
VIIIITDGKASDQHNALHETAALKRQGVQIIGIAAGTKLNIDQFIDNLYAIFADKSLVFTTSFHGLDTIVDKITKSTCDMGKLTIRVGLHASGKVELNTARIYGYKLIEKIVYLTTLYVYFVKKMVSTVVH